MGYDPKNSGSGLQFVRFLLVGVLNTAVGYLIFAGFLLVSVPTQMSLALAFLLGVIWNFWTHARMVFGQGGMSKLPAYMGVYICIWAFNALALRGAEAASISPLVAQAILAPIAAVLSFIFIGRVLTGSFPFTQSRAN